MLYEVHAIFDNSLRRTKSSWKLGVGMTVTAFATAGTLTPASAQLIGGVNPNQNPTPVLFKNGIGNNSYPVIGAALAPGTVSLVFGSGLASQTASPGVVPLVTNFNGTDMLVGGVDAPLYYLSDGQLDIEIPFELAPNRQYQAIVAVNGALTLPEIASAAFLSPFHFLRGFKEVFRLTPHEYLSACRVERAKFLLERTELPVTEICFSIGFESLGSFSSWFTRLTGSSPRAWRSGSKKAILKKFPPAASA